jgi:hypothetical protein
MQSRRGARGSPKNASRSSSVSKRDEKSGNVANGRDPAERQSCRPHDRGRMSIRHGQCCGDARDLFQRRHENDRRRRRQRRPTESRLPVYCAGVRRGDREPAIDWRPLALWPLYLHRSIPAYAAGDRWRIRRANDRCSASESGLRSCEFLRRHRCKQQHRCSTTLMTTPRRLRDW